jgi:ketosteroid isomerase-like protein
MKTLYTPFFLLLVIFLTGTTGCANQGSVAPPTSAPAPAATTETASAIVLKMVERMNSGDLEGSLAYFAEDAMGYIVGLPPTGMEVYAGKDAIRALWQDSIDNHFQWEVEITNEIGREVSVNAKTWHDFTRQLDIAPLSYYDTYEVEDGKIITYSTVITSESLGRLKPALAEVMPPEEPPAPSSGSPVSELAVTIANGTCTTDNPDALQAGEVTFSFEVLDQANSLYALSLFTLDEGKDLTDLMASTTGMPPTWADMLLLEELKPGKSKSYTLTLEQGPLYVVCWSQPPDLAIGNAGPIEVVQ